MGVRRRRDGRMCYCAYIGLSSVLHRRMNVWLGESYWCTRIGLAGNGLYSGLYASFKKAISGSMGATLPGMSLVISPYSCFV